MKTQMGAAGVRTEITDNSEYSVVVNPNAIAGVVGFAPKGELNKILTLTNTGEQDTYLGLGYNNPKYNQAMYAARAVLNAGGHVEFVRPYGEEIDKTNAYKRDLKTDTFVVSFDKNAALYTDKPRTSFNAEHFASTRYKTDGAAAYGITRKINNSAETITEGTNIKFSIDGADDFKDSAKCRKYDPKKVATDMVLFAIMNADPTAASRAYSRYDVIGVDNSTLATTGKIVLTLSSAPVFIEGDTIYAPASEGSSIKTHSEPIACLVTRIVDTKVTIEWDVTNGAQGPSAVIFCDTANAVSDGADYVTVKTAVAGRGVKTLSGITLGKNTGVFNIDDITNGSLVAIKDKYGDVQYVRMTTGRRMTWKPATGPVITADNGVYKVTIKNAASFLVPQDILTVAVNSDPDIATEIAYKTVTVESIEPIVGDADDFTVKFSTSAGDTFAATDRLTILKITEYSAEIDYEMCDIRTAASWGEVTKAITDVLKSDLFGYGYNIIVNDIETVGYDNRNVITLEPSSAYDYAIGDKVAITAGTVDNEYMAYYRKLNETSNPTLVKEVGEKDVATAGKNAIVLVTEIVNINALSGTITLADDVPQSVLVPDSETRTMGTKYALQLLDISGSMFSVYSTQCSVNRGKTIRSVSVASDYTSSDTIHGYKISTMTFGTDSITDITFVDGYAPVTNSEKPVIELKAEALKDSVTGMYATKTVTLLYKVDGNKWHVSCDLSAEMEKAELTVPADLFAIDGQPEYACVKDEIISDASTGLLELDNLYLISSYSLYVSSTEQAISPVTVPANMSTVMKIGSTTESGVVVEKSAKVLADSNIGASFQSIGIANSVYADVNFDGNSTQVYALTPEGEMIARMYLSVAYMFNGNLYEFEGTVIQYVLNDNQLFIGDAADDVLEGSGAKFILNDTGDLDIFLENNSYDLSQTIVNGRLSGSVTAIAFNENDPAILNDAVWKYEPLKNNSTSTISNAWNLFLDKDASDVSFLVAAGCAVNNLFVRGMESLNTQIIQAMLNICEKRKDCFALFDGVGEAKIDTALRKNTTATGFSSIYGRWGAIYDGRGIVRDTMYTNSNVEIVKSIQLASRITANRSGGVWWNVPSGMITGTVPSEWGTREKYPRRYSYSGDPTSDVAKLTNIHVNATRSNKDGLFIWGDWTMQMEDTAFNQIHVAMLMAGVHKQFGKYLDKKVFRLNTSVLRSTITADLQGQLNAIMSMNPAGFYEAVVICNDTNNTPDIIDQNKLIVDLKVKPTKSTRYIYLRSEVLSTASGNTVSSSLK